MRKTSLEELRRNSGTGVQALLDEAHRLQAEVRVLVLLNQTSGGHDCFLEAEVSTGNAEQFSRKFIVFNDLKPKSHRIQSACKERFVAK